MPSVVDSSVALHPIDSRNAQLGRFSASDAAFACMQFLLRHAGALARMALAFRSATDCSRRLSSSGAVSPHHPPPRRFRCQRRALARAPGSSRTPSRDWSTCRRRRAKSRSRRSCPAGRRECTRRLRAFGLESLRAFLCAGRWGRPRRRRPLVGLHVLSDDLEGAHAIALAGEGDIEVPRLELEQAGQQLGVIDLGAVGRVAITAGTRVDADAPAIVGGESRQRKIVQSR